MLFPRVEHYLMPNLVSTFTRNHGRRAIEDLYRLGLDTKSGSEKQEYRKLAVTQTLMHVGRPQAIQAVRTGDLIPI
jgi:hypothetical protein